ncbi:phosphatase YwpJ [Halobacillus andaensis]|uniref:Phosphatase YwpJ n=1 Tax=Halobacillus andaensis TaxID=1176239 RepID=A0A917B256_HALAA|nr:Cof-type HAD-IIB family hydrolase [Halobacillus andaensis]MBP2004939.1 Cof subfamily protein (haloacid dehalogenase superfamily) [Halobacillus andaensis]GGF17738.1 phosphatase YwpJ [Halobacillus andaensis]
MKMIAIDLDGTLLNNESEISQENLEAIQRAQQEGVEIVVATGRAEFDVREVFSKTGLTTWVIGANGATIHTPEGELFDSVPIQPNDAEEILSWLEAEDYYYEVFSDDAILTPENGRDLLYIELDRIKTANPDANIAELEHSLAKQFGQTGFKKVPSYKEIVQAGVPLYNVLAFSFEKEKRDKGWRKFEGYEDVTLVSSGIHNFELEHKYASKGIALEKLAAHFGYSLRDTAAIGDSPNDLSMLNVAGHRAAMANARDSVLEASDFVTKTNDEHGVAHAISHWLT